MLLLVIIYFVHAVQPFLRLGSPFVFTAVSYNLQQCTSEMKFLKFLSRTKGYYLIRHIEIHLLLIQQNLLPLSENLLPLFSA